MRLFHSGSNIIKVPDLSLGRKDADFGPGFYMSSDLDFAMRWTKARKDAPAFINVYDLDTEGLKVKRFTRDEEWFDYINGNRNRHGDTFDTYDVIIGPIANDTLYDVFGLPTSGLLGKKESLELLKIGGEYLQIVVKTQDALSHLQWSDAIRVDYETSGKYRDIVKKETEEYRQEFQFCLEKMME